MNAFLPYIPESITVHLGAPNENAQNVTLPFIDYIKNVASSEIYPTWPENALRANIYAQISFALNRIYTQYYRNRGYNFDITNSTAIDQYFVYGREIFDNIQSIVDEIFNDYIRRQGSIEPLYAQFCNGTTVTCEGLSQWGTVELANQGLTPYEILTYYYGNDIDIIQNAPVLGISAPVPDLPLRRGDVGDDVRSIQIRLNRISDNYPSIPKIAIPDGVFSFDTEETVRAFQEAFDLTVDGIIGKSTWYAIQYLYNAVKRLNELDSEGIRLEEVTKQYPDVLSLGATGDGVSTLQFYINFLSQYYATIPPLTIDGVFGESTRSAVIDLQNTFGLTPDGIVGEETWDILYNAYLGIVNTVPVQFVEGNVIPYPGVSLRLGSEDEAVRVLQEYLSFISGFFPEIPAVTPTGYFGNRTRDAVLAFQRQFGIQPTGTVGALTWDAIADLYSDLYNGSRLNEGQFPGYSVGS